MPCFTPRSTSHICWPDFSGFATRMGYGDLQPDYKVCFLEDHGTVIQSIDFLEADRVRWQIEDEHGNPASPA